MNIIKPEKKWIWICDECHSVHILNTERDNYGETPDGILVDICLECEDDRIIKNPFYKENNKRLIHKKYNVNMGLL